MTKNYGIKIKKEGKITILPLRVDWDNIPNHPDMSLYQTKSDNSLPTVAKTVVGSISELKNKLDNLHSNNILLMTGYSKASEFIAITNKDSLNTAIGKLEKGLDTKITPSATDTKISTHNASSTAHNDLRELIKTNKNNISTNKSNISINTNNITINKNDITTNAGNIKTNKDNIALNKSAIETNAKNIKTNETNISNNAASILSNSKKIKTNETNISNNATNIQTNKTNIQTNKTSISVNATNIQTNKTNIQTNATNIQTNKTNIEANKTNIQTNKTNIAANAAAISSNQTNISTNATAITNIVNGNTIVGKATNAGTAAEVDWAGVKNPPSSYAPSAHTHITSDITTKNYTTNTNGIIKNNEPLNTSLHNLEEKVLNSDAGALETRVTALEKHSVTVEGTTLIITF